MRNLSDEAAAVKNRIARGEQLWAFRTRESEVEMNFGLTGK
jgi:hypothetical protein